MGLTKRELIVNKALEKAPLTKGGKPRCGYVMGATGWVCNQARLDQQARQYPEYADMIRKYGPQWLDMQCYDCAQLNRTALAAAGYKLVSGATSQHNMPGMWEAKGTMDNHPADMRGISIFIQDKATGKMKHVAVDIGDSEIEARGHNYGVVWRNLAGTSFTHWAQPVGLDSQDITVIIQPMPANYEEARSKPILKKGSKGADVVELQSLLILHGVPLPKYGPDGDFGKETETAVKQFQALHAGLVVDGKCGPLTWSALLDEPEVDQPDDDPLYTVTVPGLSLAQADALVAQWPSAKKTVK